MAADITGVLEMAQVRVANTILDCNKIQRAFVSGNKIFLELDNGRNFELAECEVKHQAMQFIEELYDGQDS